MRINLISDLHSEFEPYCHPKVDADVLVVAGDHGNQFNYCVGKNDNHYKEHIVLAGNHDYYDNIISKFDIPNIPKPQKIYEIDDYVFVACTLWTNFWGEKLGRYDREIFAGIKGSLNDFHYIKGMTLPKMMELFKSDLQFIKDNVKKYKDKKVVICTHFAPSKKAIAKQYEGDSLNKYFVNDLDNFILKNKNIKAWLFGHTHSSLDFMIGDCRCVCNPKGYGNENPDFDPCKIIEI